MSSHLTFPFYGLLFWFFFFPKLWEISSSMWWPLLHFAGQTGKCKGYNGPWQTSYKVFRKASLGAGMYWKFAKFILKEETFPDRALLHNALKLAIEKTVCPPARVSWFNLRLTWHRRTWPCKNQCRICHLQTGEAASCMPLLFLGKHSMVLETLALATHLQPTSPWYRRSLENRAGGSQAVEARTGQLGETLSWNKKSKIF